MSVDPVRFEATTSDGAGVCFAVEGASFDCGHSRFVRDGAVLTTRVRGRVASVDDGILALEDDGGTTTRVRTLLPEGIGLNGLLGRFVSVEVTHKIGRMSSTIIDGIVRDGRGRLLLWAHDGALSQERSAQGLQLRIAHLPDGAPRLAFGTARRGVVTVDAGRAARIDAGDAEYVALVLRVRAGDAAYVLVRL